MTGNVLLIFTLFHVALSLIGLSAGAITILGFLWQRPYRFWNSLFLWATGITCFTGFLFPFHGITPGIVVGVICLVAIAVAVFARRSSKPRTFIGAACFAEALNVIVLIAQLFEKVSFLHRIAPTGQEPAVAVCQLLALLLFFVLAWIGIRRDKTY